jgi:antirestriction protein
MTTKTETNLVAWNGETYKGAGDWYDKFKTDPEFLEYTEDLDNDEILRLAMYAYNNGYALVPEDLPAFIGEEQENFRGEAESEAEFTREIIEEMGYITEDMPTWICIQVIDIDGNYRQFFWWNS